jgi:Ser/Thr protein kinase RdoA (MazF antagonist)
MARRSSTHPYSHLTPDLVIASIEAVGFQCDGRVLALNSYENRVYQVWLEDGPPLIAKFYRPGRWSDEQIREEHALVAALVEDEIPAVAPLPGEDGDTLHRYRDFRFASYPKRGGRAPELEDRATLEWLGRVLGRMHAIGAVTPFAARPALDIRSFGATTSKYGNSAATETLEAAPRKSATPTSPVTWNISSSYSTKPAARA